MLREAVDRVGLSGDVRSAVQRLRRRSNSFARPEASRRQLHPFFPSKIGPFFCPQAARQYESALDDKSTFGKPSLMMLTEGAKELGVTKASHYKDSY